LIKKFPRCVVTSSERKGRTLPDPIESAISARARTPRWESGTGESPRPRQIGEGDGGESPIPAKSGTGTGSVPVPVQIGDRPRDGPDCQRVPSSGRTLIIVGGDSRETPASRSSQRACTTRPCSIHLRWYRSSDCARTSVAPGSAQPDDVRATLGGPTNPEHARLVTRPGVLVVSTGKGQPEVLPAVLNQPAGSSPRFWKADLAHPGPPDSGKADLAHWHPPDSGNADLTHPPS
jgi:hypothetical protein